MLLVCTQPVCMLVIGSWASMPNFFFNGGDTGISCTINSDCGSKSCGNQFGSNAFLIDGLWKQTGCSTETLPKWAYLNWDGTDSTTSEMYKWCTASAGSIESRLCSPVLNSTKWPICHNAPPADKDNLGDCQKGDTSCICAMDSNALFPNTTIGWCIQIFGTYGGFFFMFWGVFEATNLHKKILRKWKALRI